VDALLTQVAEEHNLELTLSAPNAPRAVTASAAVEAPKDDLSARLAELKAR
jgi:hypothetical protein